MMLKGCLFFLLSVILVTFETEYVNAIRVKHQLRGRMLKRSSSDGKPELPSTKSWTLVDWFNYHFYFRFGGKPVKHSEFQALWNARSEDWKNFWSKLCLWSTPSSSKKDADEENRTTTNPEAATTKAAVVAQEGEASAGLSEEAGLSTAAPVPTDAATTEAAARAAAEKAAEEKAVANVCVTDVIGNALTDVNQEKEALEQEINLFVQSIPESTKTVSELNVQKSEIQEKISKYGAKTKERHDLDGLINKAEEPMKAKEEAEGAAKEAAAAAARAEAEERKAAVQALKIEDVTFDVTASSWAKFEITMKWSTGESIVKELSSRVIMNVVGIVGFNHYDMTKYGFVRDEDNDKKDQIKNARIIILNKTENKNKLLEYFKKNSSI